MYLVKTYGSDRKSQVFTSLHRCSWVFSWVFIGFHMFSWIVYICLMVWAILIVIVDDGDIDNPWKH